MPVKITKSLTQSKHEALITTYVTGAPVAPVAGHVAVYVDLAAGDQHRGVEVQARLKELADAAREQDYDRPGSTTTYWRLDIDEVKADIVKTTTSTSIVEGMVAIGVEGTVISGSRGSIIIDAALKEIIEWANEQDRLTV